MTLYQYKMLYEEDDIKGRGKRLEVRGTQGEVGCI